MYKTSTPTAYDILKIPWMQTKLANHLMVDSRNIHMILRHGNPTVKTKEKWVSAINEMLGTSYTFFELFPIYPQSQNK